MKYKLLLLLLLLVSGIVAKAQTALETLSEIKGNPEYVLCSAKNALPEKARSMCLNKLVLELNELSSDMVTQEQVVTFMKELSIKNGDVTEIHLYVRKADLGIKTSASTKPSTPANTKPSTPANTTSGRPRLPLSVSFKFTDDWGYGEALRTQIESSISKLLTAVNLSLKNKQQVNLEDVSISVDAAEGLKTCLKELPYYCTEKNNVKRCFKTATEYMVQDIPVYSYKHKDHNKNISITFDQSGQITCVRFAAELESYEKIMKNDGEEITDATDITCRTSILSFVENYRNYYINKEIKKIEQIFADDAIIITGTIVKKAESKKGDKVPELRPGVFYKKQNKEEYINSLKNVFDKNKSILVLFDDIHVIKDPKRPGIYGVTLKQSWDSRKKDGTSYHDVGYVFLMWDFQEPEKPKIHVRTWQPEEIISKPEDVLGLPSFRY